MTTFKLLSVLCVLFLAVPALGEPPAAGGRLPVLTLPAPQDPAARDYLGVQGRETFGLTDLKADLILLEVVGVYCPFCVKQAPGYKTLHARLNKGKLKGRVAMFGLAAGGTEEEVRRLLGTGQYLFPVLGDPNYTVHKQLGEPLTPYTILCRPDGSVLFAHLGVIEDIEGLYQQIKGFLD